jgi:diadenosine tetraphosphatase ApaH/serine/threonine PP2A family protein phosphatase
LADAVWRPYSKLVDHVLFLNAGSVGKPKDGDWRACYVVLTPGADDPVEFVRLPYDLEGAMAAIRATDLPSEFADDLKQGRARADATDVSSRPSRPGL